MADYIPEGINRTTLLKAIKAIDQGVAHNFAGSIAYDVIHEGKKYPPKAVVGLASEYIEGRPFTPYDFKAGLDSKCFRILKQNGFEIAAKEGVDLRRRSKFSAREFEHALRAIELTEKHLLVLKFHYEAPQRTVTAQQVSAILGSTGHHAANSAYGHLAKKVGNHLDVENDASVALGYLVTFTRPNNSWTWTMRPELATALESLGIVQSSLDALPNELPNTGTHTEGAVRVISVNAYERSSTARKKCIQEYGTTCQVCGLDMGKRYGSVGQGYVHVHHLKEIASIGETYEVDPIKDLRPVCPNCHAIIHRRTPAYSIEEVQGFLEPH